MSQTALIILDAQVNMFTGKDTVYQAAEFLACFQTLAEQARYQRIPVILIMHDGGPGAPDEPGTPGWYLHPDVGFSSGDIVLSKHTPDAFMGTQLYEVLEENEITHLVIAGIQTELCVLATCQRAQSLGYAVTLISDGHTTFDFPGEATAVEKISRVNQELAPLVTLTSSQNISFQKSEIN